MSRYIDADRLLEEIEEWIDVVGTVVIGKGLSYYAELMGCIEDTPTADVVETPVRCKDCKHAYRVKEILFCYELTGFSEIVESDFFCKYGERKNG